ncbi:Transposon TX1 uncharacterized protein [Nymphaea thermarum]|nr:Transposon TX1 uncharacterized protein [Nymphaea thermarum]
MSMVSHACAHTLLRQPSFGYLPANGVAGGILLAWSPPLTGNVMSVGKYSISVILNGLWPNGPVLITTVYGPCVGALRNQLWAELCHARELASLPWLLAGDFNCLLSPADSSPITFGPSMSVFRSFIDQFGLFDVPLISGEFTWSNNRIPPILRRLDRVFLSPELFSVFPLSSLVLGSRHLSDHDPLLLTLLRGRAGSGRSRFRFELWWLQDESFVNAVPRWWARTVNGRWAAFRLSRKLHCIRKEVIAWKHIFWSGKFSEVAIWDEEILSLQSSDYVSADQSSRLLCLQCLAQEWRIRESIHWQQRSRLGWLAHGDQNSRFFHLAASQRRRQTLLQSMVIGHREFLDEDILPALTAHFRDFDSKPLRFRAPLPDIHLSSISISCAINLEQPFLHEEIKNVVWALGSGKAPGIDGFPAEFFRTFWEACSKDVFEFCDEFASNSVFLKEFNQATCVLVPKRPSPTDVSHFRPISILGTPYKIVAKLLSLRLAPLMPSIINPFQVAFIKGRRLHDIVVLANEVVHSLYCLRLPSFILKLDISKAFDSVSWEFLSDILTRLAFGPSFRQWILSLVTGAQLAVSFNGLCGEFFCLGRGLRQGCPLSPLLFNLVAECFSALFRHAIVVGFITPHSLPHLQTFSTLQYADDFLLFGTASRQQIVRTWLILRVFELVSGLSINSSKCHLSLLHADPALVLLAEDCFGCKAAGLPMDYLGHQITLSPPAPSFWDGVEQKLSDRLHCWQGKLLSLPGRLTFAKHCLASIPLHALAVFRPPSVVLRRFDKIIRNFIWDGDRLPRLLGGAGITNLSRACESSLCSWWWRLATESSLISLFICSKYDMSSPSDWNISTSHTSPSHFWSGLLSAIPLFLRFADLPPLAPPLASIVFP